MSFTTLHQSTISSELEQILDTSEEAIVSYDLSLIKTPPHDTEAAVLEMRVMSAHAKQVEERITALGWQCYYKPKNGWSRYRGCARMQFTR